MSTLDHNEPDERRSSARTAPERSMHRWLRADRRQVTGIVVFLVSLGIFVAVCGVCRLGHGQDDQRAHE